MLFDRVSRSTLSLALAAGLALTALSASASYDPVRKGAGETRSKLNGMERKPFDFGLLGKLSDWKNGSAPTAATLEDKVVLIVTYSDWYRPAARGLAIARRVLEAHGKDGLVVIAVHNPEGWNDAAKPAGPAGTTMLLAHDEKGEFRKALLSAQDPNFYLIDRSGQLRFADIANESVEDAAAALVREKREEAATLNEREAAAKLAKEREALKSSGINQDAELLKNLPELPFQQPGEKEYKDAKWPELPKNPNNNSGEVPAEKRLTLPQAGWSPQMPLTTGRATLIYFWHPSWPATFEYMQPYADLLQRQNQRDVVVIGALTNMERLGDRGDSQTLTEAEKAKRNLTSDTAMQKINEFRSVRKYEHAMVVDLAGSLLQQSTSDQQIPIPFVAIASTDGVIRWWGFAGATEAKGALDRILAVDPGIQARRKVEAEYIKTMKKDAK